jgi:hypothetical protein
LAPKIAVESSGSLRIEAWRRRRRRRRRSFALLEAAVLLLLCVRRSKAPLDVLQRVLLNSRTLSFNIVDTCVQ